MAAQPLEDRLPPPAAAAAAAVEGQRLEDKLPLRAAATDHPQSGDLPAVVRRWLGECTQLRAVPFSYLVPDERLLPPEALRFFRLDPEWLRCLCEGALSLACHSSWEQQQAADLYLEALAPLSLRDNTGVLLRSELVSGWPDLKLRAYDEHGEACEIIRQQRLGPNVLLCLWQGNVVGLDISHRPEALHFTVERHQTHLNGKTRMLDVARIAGSGGAAELAKALLAKLPVVQLRRKAPA